MLKISFLVALYGMYNFKKKSILEKIRVAKEKEILENNLIKIKKERLLSLEKQILQMYWGVEKNESQNEYQASEELLTKKFREGEVFLKMFPNNCWPQFLDQLKDYKNRPKIRNENIYSTKNRSVYKYIHLKDEIIEVRSKEESLKHKSSKNYTHTKKTSVSYISQHLCTAPFVSEGSSEVGTAFDREGCVIKSMFFSRQGKAVLLRIYLL